MCGRHTSNSPECKINNIIEEVLVRKNIRSMIMNNIRHLIKKIRFHTSRNLNLCANSYGIKYIFKHTFSYFFKNSYITHFYLYVTSPHRKIINPSFIPPLTS